MDIRNLQSFITVAQCLSFTEAAKRIYIGQSALSKQIADLESELGVELFIRHHRSLELTPAGKTLLKEGNALMTKITDIVEKTRQAQRGIRGSLKIGCFGFENAFLPYSLKKFRALYPQISVDIRVLTLRMIENAIESGELDLGFTLIMGREIKANRFSQRLIHRTPLCFLLPGDHPYAGAASLDISALAADSFIVLSDSETPDGFNWFMNLCAARGFTPCIASKTTRMESIYWYVEAGVGISFMPKDPSLARHVPANISLVSMQGKEAYCNIMATWRKEHTNPAVPLFLKVLNQFSQDTQPDTQEYLLTTAVGSRK
ncbi:LysR family transcriptional regulator [Sporomusa termitida]|uniref:HTH-type transcriptional regulator HdfR n=1 Tax=Sporomusa termitida TaxID=2377 RepID=A0A517DVP3_9FIRM|nr:LysR family transcriptional regulator [Sporomusa termitida]QDR81434.1 HTH-type transcriptional regulator HdfR [Sporomusa termitida]